MFVALKSGITAKISNSGVTKELCKILYKNSVCKYQAASLTRAAFRNEEEIPNIKPFPYHEKNYNVLNMILDTNKCRVHKHSKIIVLDGPIASGKNQLAKELAKEFDFLYLPQPTLDDIFVNSYGFDFRTLDDKLPKDGQTWDIERFLQNPTDWNTASMQTNMLLLRQFRWITCLTHILCTGQGVVTVRSPWSDFVFAKAMAQSKYISGKGFEAYMDMCLASLHLYLKPHLVIYLDVPVNITQQNIKKRGLTHEVNAKALTEKYLTDMEEIYKRDFLSKINEHSLLLIYDWSQGGDTEVVVEDIENLNFDDYEGHDLKLRDWRFHPYQWKVHSKHYANDWPILLQYGMIMRTDVPEMMISGEDLEKWYTTLSELPDMQYVQGYNPLKGDKDLLWKSRSYVFKDNVTPLMKKYYERKQKGRTSVSAS